MSAVYTPRLGQVLACVVCSLLPAAFAASGPPPITVQGVVEEINDVLRTPYAEALASFTTTASSTQVRFDVPVGKRLIVESIAVRARLDPGQVPELQMFVRNTAADIALTPQPSAATFDTYIATLPLKVRVDGSSTFGFAFRLSREGFTGLLDLRVAVFGYLVDIAQ